MAEAAHPFVPVQDPEVVSVMVDREGEDTVEIHEVSSVEEIHQLERGNPDALVMTFFGLRLLTDEERQTPSL